VYVVCVIRNLLNAVDYFFHGRHETEQGVHRANSFALAGRGENCRRGLTEACRFRGALALINLIEHCERVADVAARATDENRSG
jgi:hypothetical protein